MVSGFRTVSCKACARLLATVTDSGLTPASTTNQSPECETCQQFRPLYDAVEAADVEYSSLQDRRDDYRPKQEALLKARTTRLAFNNWLLSVESDVEYGRPKDAYASQASKRPRSQSTSPTPNVPTFPTTASSGHLLESDAKPSKKRFRFSEEVEFQEHYRPSHHYDRSNKSYVRGRYAAPDDGEHLDTSGSSKTFMKFTGMKKVRNEWVDVWTDGEEDNVKDRKVRKRTIDADNVPATDTDVKSVYSVVEENSTSSDPAQMDARSQRLARRRGAQNVAAGMIQTRTTHDSRAQIPSEGGGSPEPGPVPTRSAIPVEDTDMDRPTERSTESRTHGGIQLDHGLDLAISTIKEKETLLSEIPETTDTSRDRRAVASSDAAIAFLDTPQVTETHSQQQHDLAVRPPPSTNAR